MCQRKCLLDKIAGSQWSCSNWRRNITHWSCFYSCCNPDFSSFLLVVGSSTVKQLYNIIASAQLAKFLLMQQQLANHFLLRRLITPKWKLLLINFRFIPRIAYTLDKVVSIDNDRNSYRPCAHPLWKCRPNNNKTKQFHRDHGGPYAPNRQNSRHLF